MENKMTIIGNIYCAGVYGMRIQGIKEYLYIGSAIEINDAISSRHLYNLKRGYYADTNKAELQKYYDMGELVFEVIHESESAETVREMSKEQKENLQIALGTLEQFYIELYKDTVVNKHMTVKKHSSNRDENSTYKRRLANRGSKNPNSKYDEKLIAEIIWLRRNGYKAKDIESFYDGLINKKYIPQLGIYKYIHIEPVKPHFIKENEIESTPIDATSKKIV